MSEGPGLKESAGANPAWLAVPLVGFALVAHHRPCSQADDSRALCDSLLPSFLHRYSPHEGVAGDGSGGAGMWSATDGRTHLRVGPLSTHGALLSSCPSLVGTGGHPADASGGLPLCLPARVRYPQLAHLDSLDARVGPLRRRRRQGADCSVDEVRALGGPRGWRSLVLYPFRAVADFRALVVYRRSLCDMSVTDGRSYLA